MNKQEVLSAALTAREEEVLHYQINIDNYSLALHEIATLPKAEQQELKGFADQLSALLSAERLEQKKAKIMLSVIKKQVG